MVTEFLSVEFKRWMYLRGSPASSVERTHNEARLACRQIKDFTIEYIEDLFSDYLKNGKSVNYIHNLAISLRNYSQFLLEKKIPFDERVRDLKIPKKEDNSKSVLSDEEIEAIISCPRKGNETKETHDMFTEFFSVLAFTGMRPGELAHMRIRDVDLGRCVFMLSAKMTKTRTERLVPIPPNMVESIKTRIGNRPQDDFLFKKYTEKKWAQVGEFTKTADISDVDWWYHFKKRLRRVGVNRPRVSIYSLRHSFVTSLLSEDVNIFKVQKVVGHKRISTTAHYTHLTTKDIQRTIRQLPLLKSRLNPHETITAFKNVVLAFQFDHRFKTNMEDESGRFKFEVSVLS